MSYVGRVSGLRYQSYGAPLEVLELIDVSPTAPADDQVTVELLASPVDPMDLLLVRGLYPLRSELPAFGGAEGVGRVLSVGRRVTGIDVGHMVLLPVRCGAWRDQLNVSAESVCGLPADLDPLQACMLRVNPLTADIMLERFVSLEREEWVIQSPGAGSVGQYVVQLARRRGLRTISVVRRPDRAAVVEQLGGEVVLIDGPDLATQVRRVVGRTPIRLALDGTGGATSARLAQSLGRGGTLVSYGAMSRQAPTVGVDALVFRDICHRGFWLLHWTQQVSPSELHARLAHLAGLGLRSELAAVYPFARWREAMKHAQADDRCGRVILCPT